MNEWFVDSLGSFILSANISYVSGLGIGAVVTKMIPQRVQGPMKETCISNTGF